MLSIDILDMTYKYNIQEIYYFLTKYVKFRHVIYYRAVVYMYNCFERRFAILYSMMFSQARFLSNLPLLLPGE